MKRTLESFGLLGCFTIATAFSCAYPEMKVVPSDAGTSGNSSGGVSDIGGTSSTGGEPMATGGAPASGGHVATPTGGAHSSPTGGAYSYPTGGAYSSPTGGAHPVSTGGAYSYTTGGAYSSPTGGAYTFPTGGAEPVATGGAYTSPTGGAYSYPTGGAYSDLTGGAYSVPTGGAYSAPTGGAVAYPTGGAATANTGKTVTFVSGKAVGAMTGYGWTSLGATDTISSPTCGASMAPITGATPCNSITNWSSTTALCVSGNVPIADVPTYASWGLDIGVSATYPATGGLGQSFTSITISVTGSPLTGLRAQVHRLGDPVGTSYCAPITSGTAIRFTTFSVDCYNTVPKGPFIAAADVTNIDIVDVQVPSGAAAIAVTNLCITGITFG